MPRISVVVPIYNVEDYLAPCLESLAQQTMRDLEVIMVDDGSLDSSASIAAAYAEQDPRFRLIQQENGGLGHARNTGLSHASGEFLAFVDSDDVVLRHGYELLLGTLEESGSDIASGNVHRLTSSGTRKSPMFVETFRTRLRGTHVTEYPPLLKDRTAWNKLWRRSFWDEHDFRWPEGVLYEDIALTIPAQVLARAVDVVRAPVYLWRIRDGEEASITQRRIDPKAIRDRHLAVDTASRFLADRGEIGLKHRYDEACAAQDFHYTLQLLDQADDDFRVLFLELVNDYFDRAHPEVFEPLRSIDRLKWHLIRRWRLDEVLDVLRFEKGAGVSRQKVLVSRHRHEGDYPFRTDTSLDIPRDVYRLDQELAINAKVEDVWWEGDTLKVAGFAYVRFVGLPTEEAGAVSLVLEQIRGKGTGRRVKLDRTRVRRPDVTARAGDENYSYDWSGFVASIPVDDLAPPRQWRNATWRLMVTVEGEGVTRTQHLWATSPGRAQRAAPRTYGDVRISPNREDGGFAVRVEIDQARVDLTHVDGDVVELHGTLLEGEVDVATAQLMVFRREGIATLSYPVAFGRVEPDAEHEERRGFVTRLPVVGILRELEVGDMASHNELQGEGVVWDLGLRLTGEGAVIPLLAPDDLSGVSLVVEGREVHLHRTRQGRLAVVERGYRPEVTDLTWAADGTLTLEGRFREPTGAAHEILLETSGLAEPRAFPMTRSGDEFRATLTPAAVPSLAGVLPLTAGSWSVLTRPVGEQGSGTRVTIDPALFPRLPLPYSTGTKDLRLVDTDFDSLQLTVTSDLLPDERGAHHQSRLQQDYPTYVQRGLRDAVLFEGYGGRQYADNPKAIAEEMLRRDTGLELLWTVEDGQTNLPDGLTPVRKNSPEWYEATARSRYVVACTYRTLQWWLTKAPDQVVLQTWHGAPFKQIGFDSERIASLAAPDYLDRLAREIDSWDILLSPNPTATPVLRSAFNYSGELLESGYPRTDVLLRPDAAERGAAVRRDLDIPEGKTVVMYAPTFRDDQRYGRQKFRFDPQFDVDLARDVLGDDYVLLVRTHQRVVDSVSTGDGRFVRNVSAYPDVNELLLATDMLVTDYSSVMFDFAATGRPMAFFTYDLEDYRDRLRGFYFDVERLPGPRLATSKEVVEALADPAGLKRESEEAYRAFTRDFCAFDDGHATERVVTRLLER
ncbi:MAG: CDP-glycerol glycerophosphotransferase family protein [Actinomycetes bacterium]